MNIKVFCFFKKKKSNLVENKNCDSNEKLSDDKIDKISKLLYENKGVTISEESQQKIFFIMNSK